MSSGWYLAEGSVTVWQQITALGEVTIVFANEAHFNAR